MIFLITDYLTIAYPRGDSTMRGNPRKGYPVLSPLLRAISHGISKSRYPLRLGWS